MDIELWQLDERGSQKKVYECLCPTNSGECQKEDGIGVINANDYYSRNTINSMRNSMRTSMPPFVNVDGSTESVCSVDSKND